MSEPIIFEGFQVVPSRRLADVQGIMLVFQDGNVAIKNPTQGHRCFPGDFESLQSEPTYEVRPLREALIEHLNRNHRLPNHLLRHLENMYFFTCMDTWRMELSLQKAVSISRARQFSTRGLIVVSPRAYEGVERDFEQYQSGFQEFSEGAGAVEAGLALEILEERRSKLEKP